MPKSIPQGLTREHVLKALESLDAGIDHPFGAATKFALVHRGKQYAPKAVVGIAFEHLAGVMLPPSEFSGGEAPGQANHELRRLGFTVQSKRQEADDEDTRSVWSDDEVELLIADYFDMLQSDLLDARYNKAEHNRQLRQKLDSRSKASVEFKHRNVSAVLLHLGLPYVDGYKPARNYQRSLVEAVRTHLAAHPRLYSMIEEATQVTPTGVPNIGDWQRLFEAPPEEMQLLEPSKKPWQERAGRKIDFLRRDAANRQLGRLGEEFAVELERRRLRGVGRDDLAGKVEWVADTIGDGLGYDLLSFNETDDSEKFIEVKTTVLGKYFPFLVSANEVQCSEALAGHYHLYRLFRFKQKPRLYVLHGALSEMCQLEPTAYRATVAAQEGRKCD